VVRSVRRGTTVRLRRSCPGGRSVGTDGTRLAREAAPSRAEIGGVTAVTSASVGVTVPDHPPDAHRFRSRRAGYDARMSDSSTGPGDGGSGEGTEDQMITDEQLPEDLQPDKNPMARDPDDERNKTDDDGSGADVGMPDMGS
jgi:hypothetical protein